MKATAQRDVTLRNASLTPTLRELGVSKLLALADGLGLGHLRDPALEVFDLLTGEWVKDRATGTPPFRSDITDDGTPFEFSVALGNHAPQLRILSETWGSNSTPKGMWSAANKLNEQLFSRHGAQPSLFERVGHLFSPLPSIPAKFAMWHAAVLSDDGTSSFKVYLNPQVVGREGARGLVERALSELRLAHASEFLARIPGGCDFPYFSLDLAEQLGGRAKLYLSQPDLDADVAEGLLSQWGLTQPGQIRAWVKDLTRGARPHDPRPIQLSLSFRQEERLPDVTVHVPVRSYVESDAQALELACSLLSKDNGDALRNGVEAMAERPLAAGRSLVTYVSLRPRGDDLGLTVYLSPQLYAIAAPRRHGKEYVPLSSHIRELVERPVCSEEQTFRGVLDMIETRRSALKQHPFFARLAEGGSVAQAQEIARRGAFFVMCFQDMLRLVRELTTEPELVDFARIHEEEDRGHDLWYLQDLARLGIDCSLRDLFSGDLWQARQTVYSQIADIVRSTDDRCRLAVVLSLEAAGAEFFASIIAFIERLGRGEGLLYFARSHQTVEQNHDIFESDSKSRLGSLAIRPAAFEESLLVVERTFAAMEALGFDFLKHMERAPVGPSEESRRAAS